MKCPFCESELDEFYDEVDLGVGVQEFLVSLFCSVCVEPIEFCTSCGNLQSKEGLIHKNGCRRIG